MLDPQAKAMLDPMPALPDLVDIPVGAIRPGMAAQSVLSPSDEVPVRKVEGRSVPGPAGEIPVRIDWPKGRGPLPALVLFHPCFGLRAKRAVGVAGDALRKGLA